MKYQNRNHRDKQQNVDYQGLGGRRKGEVVFNKYKDLVWPDEKVLEMDGGVAAQQCECTNVTELYT